MNMLRLPLLAGIAGCFLLSVLCCQAEDAPRIFVTVVKKTAGKGTDRVIGGEDRNRPQELAVTVTNQSMRSLPAGVVQWSIVVRKSYGSSWKHSGKKELPPLLSFKSAEVTCGSFDVESRRHSSGNERDRIEYEIVILHGGKESYRTASVSNFAALAEKAESSDDEWRDFGRMGKEFRERMRRMPSDEKPAEPAIIGAEKMPPQKPVVAVADISRASAKTDSENPPVPQQKFDFFNLAGKTAPDSK